MASWAQDCADLCAVQPDIDQVTQCEQYLDLMQRWNRAYNLTAVRERERMITHHLLDSLAISNFLTGRRLLDVGTGAGLPGIPLAIVHRDREFVLLDSNGKKTRFLDQVRTQLKLDNVTVIQHRAEQLLDKRGFDMVLSRAFASLTAMTHCTDHLISSSGQWLAMKGVYPAAEIENLPPDVVVHAVHSVAVPGLDAERHIVIMRKAIDKQ